MKKSVRKTVKAETSEQPSTIPTRAVMIEKSSSEGLKAKKKKANQKAPQEHHNLSLLPTDRTSGSWLLVLSERAVSSTGLSGRGKGAGGRRGARAEASSSGAPPDDSCDCCRESTWLDAVSSVAESLLSCGEGWRHFRGG